MKQPSRSFPTNPDTVALALAMLLPQTPAEMQLFLRDLLTESEIEEFAARLKAACLLRAGVRYLDVQEQTGLSSATVARVAAWLKRGLGGYQLVLDRTSHRHNSPVLQEAVS